MECHYLTYDNSKLHSVGKAVSSQTCYPNEVSSSRCRLPGLLPFMDSSMMMSLIPHSSCDSWASLALVSTVTLVYTSVELSPKQKVTGGNRHFRGHIWSIHAFSVSAFLVLHSGNTTDRCAWQSTTNNICQRFITSNPNPKQQRLFCFF